MVLTLGRVPEPLVVVLTPKADFTARLHCRSSGDEQTWPVDTKLELGIHVQGSPEKRWPFQITGAVADLLVPEDDISKLVQQMVRAKATGRLWLEYGSSDQGEFLWASGPVQIRG